MAQWIVSRNSDNNHREREPRRTVAPSLCWLLSGNFEHAVKSEPGINRDIGSYRNLIHRTALNQILDWPVQVLRIATEHGGTRAAAVIEWNDEPVRVFFHQ